MLGAMRRTVALAALLAAPPGLGCKDLSSFTTAPGDAYCGTLVDATFVQSGFTASMQSPVTMRMTFDADHLNDTPGTLSTDDKLLVEAPMRPIPPLPYDALFTLQFGEGRDKNLIYMVDPNDPAQGPTLIVFLSLMHSGDAEVRLLRGAPAIGTDASPSAGDGTPLFGVFPLHRETGQCSF
jgi:hypothetical protein